MVRRFGAGVAVRRHGRRVSRFGVAFALAMVVLGLAAVSSVAAPVFRVVVDGNTTVAPGGTVPMLLSLLNVGDVPTDGSEMTLTMRLGPGLTGVQVTGNPIGLAGTSWSCPSVAGETTIVCTNSGTLTPRAHSPGVSIPVLVARADLGVSGPVTSSFELSGGGAPDPGGAVETTVVTSAPPEFGIDAFDGQVSGPNGEGYTLAGGHPQDASVTIDFNTTTHPNLLIGPLWPVEAPKDVFTDLPAGFAGNPTVATQCTIDDLAQSRGFPFCAPSSQIGTTEIRLNALGARNVLTPVAVYSMVPPPDAPAQFGFNALGTTVLLTARLRTTGAQDGGYAVSVDASNIPEGLGIAGTTVTLWGTPADPSHDDERACARAVTPFQEGPTCPSGSPRQALVRNPTSCTEPGRGLITTAHVDSWVDPGDFRTASFESHLPPAYPQPPGARGPVTGATDCAGVPFDPTFEARPTPGTANTPSGLVVDLGLPQTDDPDVRGQSDLRRAVVTLPLGMRVWSAAANGLEACASTQIGLGSLGPASCPTGSKVGTLSIDTPLLEDPLPGAVYLARPFDNPFNSLIALYFVARGPGFVVKLAGKVEPDPFTGQVRTVFDNQPQVPFSNLHVEFDSGLASAVVTPRRCGTYETTAELTSWSNKTVVLRSPFTVTQDARGNPCPSTFSPAFEAFTRNPVAGALSAFVLRLERDDEDQVIDSLQIDMPEGVLGRVADVELCSERAANAGTCGEGSRVGGVTVGAGAGQRPFYINDGRVYFTGPYKGAPFGLSIVVPAVAGPFDLGTVVVRSAIFVDKHDATLRVVSDPLPTILEGIPLDVRDVRVRVDRRGFIINPTSCAPKRVEGTIRSTEGATAQVSSEFQLFDCGQLKVRPRMRIVVGGPGHTGRGATTPLTTTLRPARGLTANLRSVRVTLPRVLNARLPVINRACTREQYEARNCRGAMAGTAEVITPLLRRPLRGGVFFVKNGNPLPDLFIALRGEVRFDLIGRTTIPRSIFLRTTFDRVPDVPFTRFTLRLVAGRQGPVGNAANLCSRQARRARAQLDYVGQNGKTAFVDQRLTVRGCGASGRRSRGR